MRTFAEPCCGDGALVRHLKSFGLRCVYAGDIATGEDALALDTYGDADAIITNPPYTRPLMHALIDHFARILPTWLLLETDWASTKQAAPFMPTCTDIVSVGPPALDRRDDDERQAELCLVSVRRSSLGRAEVSCAWVGAGVVARQLCAQCGKAYRPQRSDSRFCSDTCRQRAHRGRLAVTQA